MDNSLFNTYASAIRNFNGDATDKALSIAADGPLSVYYALFDW